MKVLNILKKFMPIIAPILLLSITASIVVVAWYVSIIQTGEIDATTKNVALEYVFDNGILKNQTRYTVKNLAFFDVDSEDELEYIEPMAVKLSLKLKNNSSNKLKYTIIFQSEKSILKEDTYSAAIVNGNNYKELVDNGEIYVRSEQEPYKYTLVTATTYQEGTYYKKDDKSIAYIDCVFDINTQNATVINDLKNIKPAGTTYENTLKKVTASIVSQTDLPVEGTYSEVTVTEETFKTDGSLYTRTGTGQASDPFIYHRVTSGTYQSNTKYYIDESITIVDLYLYGVQEIDTALNDDFIYTLDSNNNKTTKTYNFTLTIIAEPQGETEVTENE